MPIHFRCPHCDKLLALGTRQGGTQIHCPKCDRLITVPPRTQVQAPPTTVLLPESAQTWWMDAPLDLPSKEEPRATPPPPPSPPADAWWLTSHEPPNPPQEAVATAPTPGVPPPVSQPPLDPLVIESPVIAPADAAKETIAPVEQPRSERRSAPRSFPRRSVLFIAGITLAAVILAAVLFALLHRSDSAPPRRIEESAAPQQEEAPNKPSSPRPFAVKYRRETTEAELRQEAARFAEVALDRGDDRTEAQRVRQLAAAAAREETPWDFGSQIMKMRLDLARLPLRKDEDSRLSALAADQLHSASLALRAALFEAAGGGPAVDAGKLRTLLDAESAPRGKWLRPEAIPALQQLLMGESASLREVLADRLARIDGPQASIALARLALFDLHPSVRRRALESLAKRERPHYQQVLLDGFTYPWPAVADHAAEALIALDLRDTVPALIRLLDRPNPSTPYQKADKKELYILEVVRINHLHNCLLCHAPSLKESDRLRGFVPPTNRPPPPPYTREYYGPRRPGQFVRADVTYFRQDFSVPLPVADHGKWPAMQRYDFLVRERVAPSTPADAANEHQQVIFFALRQLTGTDAGSTAEDWKHWLRHAAR